jgi:hypothetical protein
LIIDRSELIPRDEAADLECRYVDGQAKRPTGGTVPLRQIQAPHQHADQLIGGRPELQRERPARALGSSSTSAVLTAITAIEFVQRIRGDARAASRGAGVGDDGLRGAKGFLAKPYGISELSEAVAGALVR